MPPRAQGRNARENHLGQRKEDAAVRESKFVDGIEQAKKGAVARGEDRMVADEVRRDADAATRAGEESGSNQTHRERLTAVLAEKRAQGAELLVQRAVLNRLSKETLPGATRVNATPGSI